MLKMQISSLNKISSPSFKPFNICLASNFFNSSLFSFLLKHCKNKFNFSPLFKYLTKNDFFSKNALSNWIKKYGIKSGSLINGISVYNTGVSYNAEDENNPITLANTYSIKRAKQNFIINAGSADTLASKGFKIVKTNDMKYLVLLEENSAVNVAEGCIYETDNEAFNNLGYCAYFVSLKESNKILVSSSVSNSNKHLEDLIAKINENPQLLRGWLTTLMKIAIITSYGIKKVLEIIRDWPI